MSSTLFQPVSIARGPRYREVAYAAIRAAILAGRFGVNEPLIEEQIAALLAISRTPVREALAILEHEGLIGQRNGRGLYICTVTRAAFVDMFVANETVEPFLVRRAAMAASAEHLVALVAALDCAEIAADAGESVTFLAASRDFHRLVGEASGNATLTQLVVRNEERTDMHLIASGVALNAANMRASNREHGAILQAIRARDTEAAARLTIYHAQSLRDRFAALFAPEQEGADDAIFGGR